jgi:hypothetical protein
LPRWIVTLQGNNIPNLPPDRKRIFRIDEDHQPDRHRNVCGEDIDYRAARGLDKSVIRALTQESVWVAQHENVFVLEPTGVGKSYVASALRRSDTRRWDLDRIVHNAHRIEMRGDSMRKPVSSRSANNALRASTGLKRGKGLRPLPRTPFSARGFLPPLRFGPPFQPSSTLPT